MSKDRTVNLEGHPVVSHDEWIESRKRLLVKEKELTRTRDRLADERRALPWVKVEKNYVFETPWGRKTLGDLFDGRSQLFIKHFMFGPDWPEGCVGCSFEVDQITGSLVHLEHHDVTYVAVSRAPLEKIETFKRRMGWTFKWVSSFGSDFNYDFGVSFTPEQIASKTGFYNYTYESISMDELSGNSVFYSNPAGEVFHTYSTYGRGGEELLTSYMVLDMMPKGRDEPGPRADLTTWVRHHDRYDAGGYVNEFGRYQPPQSTPSEAKT